MAYSLPSDLIDVASTMSAGTWASVPITGTISSVTADMPSWSPNNGADITKLFGTWNSGAPVFIGDPDIDGYYMAATGGHNNYGGNQVYWLRWADMTLYRLNDADSYDSDDMYINGPALIDGGARPTARETYAGVVYEPDRGEKGSVILIGGAPYQLSGSSTPSVYALDLAKLHAGAADYWERLADRGWNAEGTVAFIDPPTGYTVFVSSPGRLQVIDYDTDTLINASGVNFSVSAYSGGWDWENMIFVKIEDPSALGGRVSAFFIQEGGADDLTDDISGVGNHGGVPTYDENGDRYTPPFFARLHFVYDEDIDKFVVSNGTRTVYFLDHLSNPDQWTWTWEEPDTGPSFVLEDAGPYHRWFALPDPYDDVYALWQQGEAEELWLYKLPSADSGPAVPPAGTPAAGDLDGDGRGDLIWRHASGELATWLMDGATALSSHHRGDISNDWSIIAKGDFDGDGRSDLIWRNASGELATWLMDGATVLSSHHRNDISNDWSLIGAGDLDGDGKADLIWRNAGGELATWLMDGATATSSHHRGDISNDWSLIGEGDLDGDGKADLIWRNASGELATWLMDGATAISSHHRSDISNDWSLIGMGDLDGDTRTDLIWRHANGELAMWLMDGATALSSHHRGDIANDWTLIHVADLDGDAKADLIWRNASGELATWLMDGAEVLVSQHRSDIALDWALL
ncbi:MAG: FG-GAP repeat domain-containing protein [Rhodospirillaceae bacterium]